eukprot:NODE_22153_length_720_cov_4.853288.p1 GENE.NODE_22153_length_720_cov_4.853288~~NODE_22153_length_720_cov_4.853288.p1  ORF type:complete len:200 (+),score=34.13 NODE_22153_length_720_cov_4.853288:89-601(+)
MGSGQAPAMAQPPADVATPVVGAVLAPAGAPPADLPFDIETVNNNRVGRVAYLEAREAVTLQQEEEKACKEIIGAEVREVCRPEIDEYVDCCVGRIFTINACKPHSLRMRRCLKRVETPQFVERRIKELLAEREANGTSILNNTAKGASRERRALYNSAILPMVNDPSDI